MNKNYVTIQVNQAVETILDQGAEKLYDKYLQQKLPNHTYQTNQEQFQNNMKILALKPTEKEKMEIVATKIIRNIPVDNLATRRVSVKRHSLPQSSNIVQKESAIDKSTKYQTIIQSQIHSQRTINDNPNNSKEIDDSMLLHQQSFRKSPLFIRSERPSTMQVGRSKAKDDNGIGDSKIIEVDQKRAATCHVRKRKQIVSIPEKKRFIRLNEEIPLYIEEDVQAMIKIRKEKKDRDHEEAMIDRAHAQEAVRIKMKEMRAFQHFQSLKSKLKGKGKYNPPITNFQNQNGEIFINGRSKLQQQAHIIHLQFNPQEEQLLSTLESKHSEINPTKTKSFFSSKLKKKLKITNEDFTNNGSRQISSIPFVTLNYGIMISQDGLQATASRRRPQNQQTREKYSQQQQQKFKSHIPIVNSARLNIFSTLDPEQTVRSSIIDHPHSNSLEKNMQTTIQSKIDMQASLLWNPKAKKENKGIRVSNRQLLQREVLESKLTIAH